MAGIPHLSIVVPQEPAMPNSMSRSQPLLVHAHDNRSLALKSNDIDMWDLSLPKGESPGLLINDTGDLKVITKDEFNLSEPDNGRTLVHDLRSRKKRPSDSVSQLEGTVNDLRSEPYVAEDPQADTSRPSQITLQDLQARDKELAKVEKHLATSKKALKKRPTNAKLQKLQRQLADSRQELKVCQKTVHRLEGENADLQDAQRKLAASQEELSACKDDLFRLQPVSQISDSDISQQFESIGQQVTHWIDAEIAAFDKQHPGLEAEQIFSVGNDKDASAFMARWPTAGEYLARYLINRYLRKNFFEGNIRLLGLPAETAQLLLSAQQSMASLDPPRDSATIAAWRSETFKALAATTNCKEMQIEILHQMNNDLFHKLAQTFPKLFTRGTSMDNLFQQVTWPTCNLAVTILGSLSTYTCWEWKTPHTEFANAHHLDSKAFKLVELTTGRYLKPDSAVVASKNGDIGEFILGLEPNLVRVNEKGERMLLQPMTLLVKLFEPIGKQNNKISA